MKKFFIYLLYFANLAFLIVFWWTQSFSAITNPSSFQIIIQFGKLAGILATYQALVQLILIGRVKWVEEVFGLDKLSRIHKLNGYTVLGFILAHIFLVTNGYSSLNKVTHLEQYLTFLNSWDDVFKAFLGYIIILVTVVLSITIVRKKLKYEWWYWIHLLNYLAYILFVGHQLHFGLSAQSPSFKIYWLGLYLFAFSNIGIYRFLLPVYRSFKYNFIVSKVEGLNNDLATSIYIEGRGLSRLSLQAGQFFILRFLQKGFWYEAHPFSLSLAPNNQHLRITAKNLGDYTAKLGQIQPGTKVLIDGPHGVFTADKAKTQKYLLIAGGIGVTPLRSMVENLAKEKKDVVMIYGAKEEAELLLLEELQSLAKNYPNFKLLTCLSDLPSKTQSHFSGYINQELLSEQVPDLLMRDVYLCGPPVMMDKLKTTLLKDMGLPKKQFHWERFAL